MNLSLDRKCFPSVCRFVCSLTLVFGTAVQAQITRVSFAHDDSQSNHDSYQAAISDDGDVIAFRSSADNLVAGDANNLPDVFVREITADTIERANVDDLGDVLTASHYRGAYWPSLSSDGNRLVFNVYNAYAKVFLRDRLANTTAEVLPLSAPSSNNEDRTARQEPFLSGNGQFVVLHYDRNFLASHPPGAAPKDDENNIGHDIFWYDTVTMPVPQIERLTRPDFVADQTCVGDPGMDCPEANADGFSPSVSDDGDRVAFYAFASNLVPDDDNDFEDVFVKFRRDAGNNVVGIAGPIIRVSESSAGVEADDASKEPFISGDGSVVAFRSLASNLVAGDSNERWDIFVHELSSSITTRVSVPTGGGEANHDSFSPSLSDDGRYVVFRSNANNLVAGDTNQRHDIFVHDRDTGTTARVSEPAGGGNANGHSYEPAISGDGNWIVFESDATDLVAGDTNQSRDIFRVANPLAGS